MKHFPFVLHLAKYFPPFKGGMENFLFDLVNAQSNYCEVRAIVHSFNGFHGPGQKYAARTINDRLKVFQVRSYGEVSYAPISPSFPVVLHELLQKQRPHILHIHLPNTSAFWGLGLKAARLVPWVVHWHSDVVPSKLDSRLALLYKVYRPFERALLNRAASIIVTSPEYLGGSKTLKPFRHKCQVIPLGLAPERLPPRSDLPLDWAESMWEQKENLRVLSIGRLTYYKGHDVLIRAVKDVPACRVIIAGKGDREKSLRRLIETTGNARRVHLAGFLPDRELFALLATADVLCLPSLEKTEAFGLVLLEAMHYGKALIASDIPGSGVGWVVRKSGAGLLFPPGDWRALAEILLRCASDRVRLERLGARGPVALSKYFHIDRVAEQIQCVYEKVLKSRSRFDR